MTEQKTWRVGVAGLGTVGGGLIKFLSEKADYAPVGDYAQVVAVSARSRSRKRDFDISGMAWFDDPAALAASPDIDIFVELVGGSDGPAKVAVEAALKAGKPVVTANKALIAEHGRELAELAEQAGSMLFSKLLIEEADVAVAPGVGFGEYGEGFVRVGLVENEHRIRQAARNVKKFLANADDILGRERERAETPVTVARPPAGANSGRSDRKVSSPAPTVPRPATPMRQVF